MASFEHGVKTMIDLQRKLYNKNSTCHRNPEEGPFFLAGKGATLSWDEALHAQVNVDDPLHARSAGLIATIMGTFPIIPFLRLLAVLGLSEPDHRQRCHFLLSIVGFKWVVD